MEWSPSWEANSYSATQEIFLKLLNPKVHYRFHKRPTPVLILSQISAVYSSSSNLLKVHFNIILLSTPGSNMWSLLFRSSHQNTECTSPVSCTGHMPSSFHSSWFGHPNSAWCAVQILKLLVMQSSPPPPVTSSPLGPNIFLRTLVSNTLNFRFSLSVSDQASHSYRATGKNIVTTP